MPLPLERPRSRGRRRLAWLLLLLAATSAARVRAADETPEQVSPAVRQARELLSGDEAGRAVARGDAAARYDDALVAALLGEGARLRDANDLHAALPAFALARDLADAGQRPREAGRARISMAQVLDAFGRQAEARALILEARDLYAAAGEAELEARAIVNLGIVARHAGDLEAALAAYEDARTRAAALGAARLQAIALNNLAVVHLNRGDLRAAQTALEAGLSLEQDETSQLYADLLANLGSLHQQQGSLDLAVDFLRRSLALQDRLGNSFGSLNERNNLAAAYLAQERLAEAREVIEESARLAEQGDVKELAARARVTLARVLSRQGHPAQATGEMRRAVTLARESAMPDALSFALAESVELLLEQGLRAAALEAAREALALAETLDSPRRVAGASLALGEALLAHARDEEALVALERAVAATELQREQVAGGEIERQRFLELRLRPYERLLEVHARRGQAALALASAERAKARVLVDALRGGRTPLESRLGPRERERERELRQALTSASAELQEARLRRAPEPAALERLQARQAAARREHEAFRAVAFASQPALRARTGALEPWTLADLEELADARTLLVEYVVTDARTYLFLFDRQQGLRVHTLALPRAELGRRTRAFRERLASRDLDLAAPARALCNALLGPARPAMARGLRLVVVPDGPLWELPFQALSCAPGRYLLEELALAYAPSLQALREMTRRARGSAGQASLLALGNPTVAASGSGTRARTRDARLLPLPEAETEVRALGRLYAPGSSVYVGREAGEARVKAEAARHQVLHFAAHGILDDARPLYSQLVLARPGEGEREDGLLEAWEIMDLELRAELAVLSACDTGRGRVGRGEGLIGLSWAFFVAGCPSTVVSQWQVDARGTSRLMLAFHRGLAGGLSKSQALRQAALALRRDPRYRHPFYWASFIVVGADQPL